MEAMDVACVPAGRAGRALEAGGVARRGLCGAGEGPAREYAASHDSASAGADGEGRYRAGRADARRSGHLDSSHASQLALKDSRMRGGLLVAATAWLAVCGFVCPAAAQSKKPPPPPPPK